MSNLQHRAEHEQHNQALAALAVRKFPLGSKVRWVRTHDRDGNSKWLEGVVAKQGLEGLYSWTLKTTSGATHERYPWDLEDVEPQTAQVLAADAAVELVRHKKTGKLYQVFGRIIDCTNGREATPMTLYGPPGVGARFVRESAQFEEKIEPVPTASR